MESLDSRSVRELASATPGTARVFEKFRIDYCCGGERSLAQACSAAKVNVLEVEEALEKQQPQGGDRDWQKASLADDRLVANARNVLDDSYRLAALKAA